MQRPCMINRIWGLKQHSLHMNGHALFLFAWAPPSCEEW